MEKIKQPTSLLSRKEEVYVLKEDKENVLDSHRGRIMPTRNKPQKINACHETSGKNNAHLLSHNLPVYPIEKKNIGTSSILARGKCRLWPTDSICQVVTGTAVIFYLAGRQDRQYVSPLKIIYTALS